MCHYLSRTPKGNSLLVGSANWSTDKKYSAWVFVTGQAVFKLWVGEVCSVFNQHSSVTIYNCICRGQCLTIVASLRKREGLLLERKKFTQQIWFGFTRHKEWVFIQSCKSCHSLSLSKGSNQLPATIICQGIAGIQILIIVAASTANCGQPIQNRVGSKAHLGWIVIWKSR